MAQRLRNGILEWAHPTDQFVVLVSRRVTCDEEQLDAVMKGLVGDPTDENLARLDEDALVRDLSEVAGQRLDVHSWQNPAGMIEYAVELEGQEVDWEWLGT